MLGVMLIMVLCILETQQLPAEAHSWYPAECCSGQDCYAIAATEVEMLPNGDFKVKATGEAFSGPRGKLKKHIRFSPDGGYHRCSYGADRNRDTICLFIPLPNGS